MITTRLKKTKGRPQQRQKQVDPRVGAEKARLHGALVAERKSLRRGQLAVPVPASQPKMAGRFKKPNVWSNLRGNSDDQIGIITTPFQVKSDNF